MENIIKKAILGGYAKPRTGWETSEEADDALVITDPLFWKSLGRACEWGDTGVSLYSVYTGKSIPVPFWQMYAENFFTINLTKGRYEAVEYLANLISGRDTNVPTK